MKSILTGLALAFFATGFVSAQDWIPEGAEIVYSSRFSDGFLPDGETSLKIKATKNQFEEAVKKLGLTLHTKERKYSDDMHWLAWSPDIGENLKPVKGKNKWNPTDDLIKTYVRQDGDTWEFMKFENGFIFYRWLNH